MGRSKIIDAGQDYDFWSEEEDAKEQNNEDQPIAFQPLIDKELLESKYDNVGRSRTNEDL